MMGIKLIKECYPHLHIILTGKYRYFGHPQKYFENIDTCYMGPMTFIEVLKNTRHAYLVDELEQFDHHHPLSQETHDSCLSLVQDYIETGGLPHIIAKLNHLSSFKSSDETPDNPFSQPHSIDSKFDHFYENIKVGFHHVRHMFTIKFRIFISNSYFPSYLT